jgi:hypothetical protein
MGAMSGAILRIFRSGLAAALLGACPVALAAPEHPAERTIEPIWTFRSGAPLRAGPGLGADGVALGTSDGYVHLLRGDGSYRWSFTVKGAVIAPPVIGDQGTVYVATSTRELYALRANGTLAWSTALAGTPLSPLEKAPDGSLLIATGEGVLYAVTPGGRMRTALTTREPLTAAPIALDGAWAAGGRRGTLFRVEGYALERVRLSSSPLTALSRAGREVLALSDGELGRRARRVARLSGREPGRGPRRREIGPDRRGKAQPARRARRARERAPGVPRGRSRARPSRERRALRRRSRRERDPARRDAREALFAARRPRAKHRDRDVRRRPERRAPDGGPLSWTSRRSSLI